MADIFDRIEEEQKKKATGTGDVFDRISGSQPAAPEPRTWLDSAKDYAGAAWEGFGGPTVMNLLGGASRDPERARVAKETAKGLVQGIINEPKRMWGETSKAGEILKSGGNTGEALYHMAGSIPMAGPAIQQVTDEVGKGEYAKAAGHGTALLAPFASKGLPKNLKVKIPGFNNATPKLAAAMEYLTEKGVPANAAAATASPFVQKSQAILESTPVGAAVGEAAKRGTTKALIRTANKLEERAAPGPMITPETSGVSLEDALTSRAGRLHTAADVRYDAVRAAEADPANIRSIQVGMEEVPTGVLDASGQPIIHRRPVMKDIGLPVDMRELKQELGPVYKQIDGMMPEGKQAFSVGLKALKTIVEGEDFIPVSEADIYLGRIKKLVRDSEPGSGQGLAKNIIPKFQEVVDAAAAQGGADVAKKLQVARRATKGKYDVQDLIDELKAEPVKAFEQASLARDAGIEYLRKVQLQAPGEMRKVGRAYLNKLFTQATAEGGFNGAQGLYAQWKKLGPSTKKILFDPKLTAELDKFFQGASAIAQNPNPSGTALVSTVAGGIGLAVAHPATGIPVLLGAGALAKLFRSPAGVRLLTNGLTIPIGSPGALVKYTTLMRMAGMAGDEEEEEKKASGGVIFNRMPDRAATLRSLQAR